MPPRRVSLPGADELFRTTGGMALSPSLAPRPAAEAPRAETARAVNGTDGVERDEADEAGGAAGQPHEHPAQGPASRPARTATGRPGAPRGASAQPYEQPSAYDRQAGTDHEQQPGAHPGRGAQPGSVPGPAQPPQVPPVERPAARQPGAQPPAAGTAPAARAAVPPAAARHAAAEDPAEAARRARPRGRTPRRPSGRERHDEKITVYVSAEELMDLEHTRLVLRGEHGLAVDRGRIVREAIAVVLADLEQRGEASILVRRLRGR